MGTKKDETRPDDVGVCTGCHKPIRHGEAHVTDAAGGVQHPEHHDATAAPRKAPARKPRGK